jgi:hypothetical protein
VIAVATIIALIALITLSRLRERVCPSGDIPYSSTGTSFTRRRQPD